MARVLEGQTLFVTGPAGSGKTELLRALPYAFADAWGAPRPKPGKSCHGLAMTAFTGIAARQLPDGKTLNSWAALGLGTVEPDALCRDILKRQGVVQRLREAKVLVVDEVSMLSQFLLELLDQVLRRVRKVDAPFGRLQLLFCGDFFQLAPVSTPQSRRADARHGCWAFQSPLWAEVVAQHIQLRQIHRQRHAAFAEALRLMRFGIVSDGWLALLPSITRPLASTFLWMLANLCVLRASINRF